MTISDKTTYSEIKQSILGYDQAMKTWTSEQVIKSLEVRPKGKHGGWIPWQPYGRGKGGLKGKSKGKSKGKEQRKTRQRQEP